MKMTAIIFSEASDNNLNALTYNRTVASLAFGGRYRMIDFVLSSIVNSGISNIGIATERNYRSLLAHLGPCREWDLDRKSAGVEILSPNAYVSEENRMGKIACQGKIDLLYTAAQEFLEDNKSDCVLIAETATVCNINFKDVYAKHKASGADVTIIANECTYKKKDVYKLVADIGEDNKLTELYLDCVPKVGQYQSIGAFLVNRKLLLEKVRTLPPQGLCHFEKDFLHKEFYEHTLDINIYSFEGTVLRNNTIAHYLKNNLALCDLDVRQGLFIPENPIFTRERDEPPTYFGPDSEAIDCAVADGTYVYGYVEKSVLGREVVIEKKAVVKNSMIMQGSVIKKGAYVENAIIDKNVTITGNVKIIGTPEKPAIIRKGSKI